MAVWQFKFAIVPTAGIIANHGRLVSFLFEYQTRDSDAPLKNEEDFFNYWVGVDLKSEEFLPLTLLLPEIDSWSSDARMFGYDDGNKIEIWSDSIYCELDARDIDFIFLEKILNFAKGKNCKIVTSDKGHVIDPEMVAVMSELNNSRAVKFLTNPVAYLKNR